MSPTRLGSGDAGTAAASTSWHEGILHLRTRESSLGAGEDACPGPPLRIILCMLSCTRPTHPRNLALRQLEHRSASRHLWTSAPHAPHQPDLFSVCGRDDFVQVVVVVAARVDVPCTITTALPSWGYCDLALLLRLFPLLLLGR